ncbi:MAG: bacteriocin [Bacteroidia bacterium]|nr:bacteriocin [Bacteroidia bacterium]
MKLSDIFRKKSTISKPEISVVKINKKELEKIIGGVSTETSSLTVVGNNKHPEGKY